MVLAEFFSGAELPQEVEKQNLVRAYLDSKLKKFEDPYKLSGSV